MRFSTVLGKTPNWLNMNRLARLGLVVMVLGALAAAPTPSPPDAYLARQAAALRPAFRADLEALADAPRYLIEASIVPEGGNLAGRMRLDYANTTGETLSALVFRLYPNAETIYGGGNLIVAGVEQAGARLTSELSGDGTILRVPLPRPLAPEETVSLDLSFSAQVPSRTSQGYGIFNRAQGVLSLAGWYPVLAAYGDDGWDTSPVPATGDAMFAETSFYEVKLTLPAGYQVVSTGTVLDREIGASSQKVGANLGIRPRGRHPGLPLSRITEKIQNGSEGVTWHVVSGPAREFAVAISDRFQMLETEAGEVRLRVYTLPADEPAVAPGEGQDMLAETFAAYVDRFGPYPFVEFDLVEAVVPIDGYEFSGMVYVDYAKRTRETRQDYGYTVAHEVAHQWWYGLVGSHSVHEPWLDEALATYSALINLEDIQGRQAGASLLAIWKDTVGPRRPGDAPVNSSSLAFSTWGPYHATVYTRGALFLDELRAELGDESFFALLRRYQREYRYRVATTGDFLRLAQEVASRDMDPLFASWLDVGAGRTEDVRNTAASSPSPERHPNSTKPRFPPRKGGPVE